MESADKNCSHLLGITLWTAPIKKPGIQADFSDMKTIQQPTHKPFETQSISTMWTCSIFTLQQAKILLYQWT